MTRSGLSPFTAVFGLSVALQGVFAGLEDAKHSKKLDHSNFDSSIAAPQVGTLTAFYAPWCGHCKSLLGVWDQVARTFETDSNCRVAHFDADNADNRDIASRYQVSGFPTIKFVFKDVAKKPLDFHEARTPEAIIKFLNKECGTYRALGGLLLPEAGRVASLDEIAMSFVGLSATDRASAIKKASQLASEAGEAMASYYVKVMNKVATDNGWLTKESERLKKLAEKGATMAGNKFEELQIKQNILQAFIAVKDAAADAAEATKEAAEQVIEKAAGEL